MNEVLSQNEIDDLLSDMASGRVDVEDSAPAPKSSPQSNENYIEPVSNERQYQPGDISSYDFRRPNRISKNQVRTFQTVHENFAEVFSYFLVSKLQTVVSIAVTSVDQLFYSEFILSVANPSCLYIFDIEGTDGSGILEMSPQLPLMIVERLLGGDTESIAKARNITAIEQAVTQGIIDHALVDLKNAWRAILEIDFTYSRLEMEADFVQIAPSSEIVIVVSFDVNIGTNQFMMNLCFPTFAMEDVLARLNRQQVTTTAINISLEKQQINAKLIQDQMANSYMEVIAELGSTSMTVSEILEMEVGDVIKLQKRVNEEIEIQIAGRRKLTGRPGTLEGRKAVRVIRPMKDKDLIDLDLIYKGKEK